MMHMIIAIVLCHRVRHLGGRGRTSDGRSPGRAADSPARLPPRPDPAGRPDHAIDGVPIEAADEFGTAMRTHQPGATVDVALERDGERADVDGNARCSTPTAAATTKRLPRRQQSSTRPSAARPRATGREGAASATCSPWRAVHPGRRQGAQPGQRLGPPGGHQRRLSSAARRLVGATQISGRRRARRLGGRAGVARRRQRVGRGVQHVPVAAARRRPCGDRDVRAHP